MKSLFLKFHIILGVLLCLLLPLFQKLIPIVIVLWALTFFFFGFNKFFLKNFLKQKHSVAAFLFFSFHIVTLFYTENLASGIFDVESKLSFLIFPLIMSSSVFYYKPEDIKYFFTAFIVGNVFASFYCLYQAFYKLVYYDAGFQYFTYTDLSALMHPTYFAMYLSLAIIICIYLLTSSNRMKLFYRITLFLAITLFSGMIYLLSSKAGLLTYCALALYLIIHFVKNRRLLITFLVGSVAVLFLVLSTNDRFAHLKNKFAETVIKEESTAPPSFNSSSDQRLHIWRTAIFLLSENWILGVGAGDLKYELSDRYYASQNVNDEKIIYFNAHNQYLETFLSVGIFGFLIFLFWLCQPLFGTTFSSRFLINGLFIILAINFMFESVLNRQEGIVFVVFFWTLFTLSPRSFSHTDLNLS